MSAIVRLAVAFLPESQRDRYREQWTADVRDAPELGLSARRVAWGALLAALATNRQLPSLQLPAAGDRSRFAVGLSAASAVLVLSSWGSVSNSGLTSIGLLDYLEVMMGGVLSTFAVVAPLLALVLISGRGIAARIRLRVGFLVAASATPYLYLALSSVTNDTVYFEPWAIPPTPAQFAYPVAGLLVLFIGAGVLRGGVLISSSTRSVAPAIGAGAILLGLGVLGLVGAVTAWMGRTPLVYGLLDAPENLPALQNWLALKIHFETLVLLMFVLVGVASLIAAAVVTALAWRATKRRFALVTITALAGVLSTYAVLTDFIGLAGEASPQGMTHLILPLAQLALVGTVFVGASGVRLRAPQERSSLENPPAAEA